MAFHKFIQYFNKIHNITSFNIISCCKMHKLWHSVSVTNPHTLDEYFMSYLYNISLKYE